MFIPTVKFVAITFISIIKYVSNAQHFFEPNMPTNISPLPPGYVTFNFWRAVIALLSIANSNTLLECTYILLLTMRKIQLLIKRRCRNCRYFDCLCVVLRLCKIIIMSTFNKKSIVHIHITTVGFFSILEPTIKDPHHLLPHLNPKATLEC